MTRPRGSRAKAIGKFLLIGCGAMTVLVLATATWLASRLAEDPADAEMSAYHPFRSEKARDRYLELYEMRAAEWPVASETRMLDTSYGQTFVRMSGPPSAPPLVLLPGANATSLMWAPNIEALSELYRVYAVDNIYDFGRSVYTRPIKTSDDFAHWLDDLFTALELGDRIHLMGLSYGGWLTSQYALRFPDRLDKIVLLAPAGTVLPFEPEFLIRGVLCLLPHPYFVRSMIYWVLEDAAQKDEASRRLVEEAAEDAATGLRCFKPKLLVNPTILSDEELQSIKVPTLYLVGENEKIYSAQAAVQRLRTVAPHIETEIIPDTGHDLTIVQAAMVNRRVLEFLSRQ
jgi:pimeloyl-ACP methyl ester carboxylesterase